MRTVLLRGIFLFISIALLVGRAGAGQEIRWGHSFTAALSEARATHKLIMADFYTIHCVFCRKLDQQTYVDKKVVQLAGQCVPVKLDAEGGGMSLADKYGVQVYPTILFLNAAGGIEGVIRGFRPPEGFLRDMYGILQAWQEFPLLQNRYRANQKDKEAVGKLAAIYALRGNVDRAVAYLSWGERINPKNEKGYHTRAYTLLGSLFEEAQDYEKALALYERAIRTGKDPYDLSFAHLHSALCYVSGQRLKEALAELKAGLAVPNVPGDIKTEIHFVMAQVKKVSGKA